jgi:predicted pyridoxine 5'-phosphate oxidase superfamily flavin-nucleotide-binding protein
VAILTDGIKRVVLEQRLGFVATVCPDGTPNLSPKGTLAVWDDEHLVFVDLRSPQTLANLAANPAMEVNVVDPIVRKGYRFKGEAQILNGGELFEEVLAFFERERGMARGRVRAAVLLRVDRAAPLISPVYDLGVSEDEVAARWRKHHLELNRHRDVSPPSD